MRASYLRHAAARVPASVDGLSAGGVVLADHLAIVVASAELPYDRWPRPEQVLALYRHADRGLDARLPFPVGHRLVAATGDVVITLQGARLAAWRVT